MHCRRGQRPKEAGSGLRPVPAALLTGRSPGQLVLGISTYRKTAERDGSFWDCPTIGSVSVKVSPPESGGAAAAVSKWKPLP
jgi:hypothetical protein